MSIQQSDVLPPLTPTKFQRQKHVYLTIPHYGIKILHFSLIDLFS
jgi:hypothetical protein